MNRHSALLWSLALGGLFTSSLAQAQTAASPSAVQSLGGPQFQNWSGLQPHKAKAKQPATATLKVPGEATFSYVQPSGDKATIDGQNRLRNWYNAFGVQFEVYIEDNRTLNLDVLLHTSWDAKDRGGVTAQTVIKGEGWHSVSLPWKSFEFRQTYSGFLHDVKGIGISAKYADGKSGQIELRSPILAKGDNVWLSAKQRGKSVEAGGVAEYEVTVGNSTLRPQAVTLSLQKQGYEAMIPEVVPSSLELGAGETKQVVVRVKVPTRIPVPTIRGWPPSFRKSPSRCVLGAWI